MTEKEILKKAIEKAFPGADPFYRDDPYEGGWTYSKDGQLYGGDEYDIIFSHDFAKAFWGEEEVEFHYPEQQDNEAFGGILEYPYDEGAYITYKGLQWKYYLQRMVLSEDPIRYLERFLK